MNIGNFMQKNNKINYLLYIICIILLLADFVVHKHTYFAWEKFPGFYALTGFISAILIALLSLYILQPLLSKKGSDDE